MVTAEVSYDEQLSGKWGTGTKLIAAAWIVEIAAAAIGLFIALLTIYSAREQAMEASGSLSLINNMNSILGGIPFLMVAVIELCKIPLATAYFHAGTRFWRVIFLFGLLFLLVITFETMMNGFERFLTTRTLALNESRDTAELLRDDISRIETEIIELEALTADSIRGAYQVQIDQIESSRAKELQENVQAVATAQETYGINDSGAVQTSISAIDKELDRIERELEQELKAIREQTSEESSSISKKITEERDKLEARLMQVRLQLRQLHAQEDVELDKASIFSTSSVREKFETRRKPLENDQVDIQDQLNKLSVTNQTGDINQSADIALRETRNRYEERRQELLDRRDAFSARLQLAERKTASSLKPTLQALEQQRVSITQKYDTQSEQARVRFNEQMEELKIREESTSVRREKLTTLREHLHDQRRGITRLAQDNQVYRVARWMFDKESAADLTQREINITTLVWFGSLAAITAWTGTLLAFGGLVVKYEHGRHRHRSDKNGAINKLARTLRRYIAYKRKRAREPLIKVVENEIIRTVEVIKEVPVDNIVLRDVPVEVVRKEMVYVPLLTDDEDLVHRNTSSKSSEV